MKWESSDMGDSVVVLAVLQAQYALITMGELNDYCFFPAT